MTSPQGAGAHDRQDGAPRTRPSSTSGTDGDLVGSGWSPSAAVRGPRSADGAAASPAQRPAASSSRRPVEGTAAAEQQRAGTPADSAQTTVLPGASGAPGTASVRRPPPTRPAAPARNNRASDAGRTPGRSRRAKLALQRIDPWSVFLYTLVSSIFLGIALIVAVAVLYAVLGRLGVLDTVNELFLELTSGDASSTPLFTAGRFVGGAVVLAAVNVVLLTVFATLGSLLYNLVASFTGGIELTLGEREG